MPKAKEAAEYSYPDDTLIEVGDVCYATARGDGATPYGGPAIGERGKVVEINPEGEGDCGPIKVDFDNAGYWWTTPEKLSFDPPSDDDDDDDPEPEEDEDEENEVTLKFGTSEPSMSDKCRECGEPYGEHKGPDGVATCPEDDDETTDEGEESPHADKRFAVGDEVRLLVRGDVGGDAPAGPKVGDTGKVTGIAHDKWYVKGPYKGEQVVAVTWKDHGRNWYVNAGRIELVTKEEPMAEAKPKATLDLGPAPEIVRAGRQITLPEGMTNLQAIEWLKKREVEDKTAVAVRHEFGGVYPLDALVAVQRAMADIYNWVANVPTPGFFGDSPPTMFTVKTGPRPDDFLTVPYGSFAIPGVRGRLEVKLGGPKGAQPNLFLAGEVAQGDMDHVKRIIARAEERLRTSSIYRGKAIKVSWRWQRDGEGYNLERDAPQFLDLTQVSEADLVFSDDVQRAIEDGLWTLLEQTDACRTNGVPLKRGILFEGPPGTGKTLTALVAAQKAVVNGWTFVYLDDVRDLPSGLRLATQYAKAVVFAEDLDRVISGERDANMDEILNCLDGVDSKGQEIITIVTTNSVDAIIKPALRPGRIDMILSTRHPDAKAASTLVRNYGRGLLSSTANLDAVGNMLEGKIPAVIREVVERSKMAAIRRLRSGDIQGKVMGEDLTAAARAMEAHASLLEKKEDLPVETTLRIPLTVINKRVGLEA